jgi:hypothetical protein
MNEVYMLWIPEKGNYYGKPVIHWFLAEDKGITYMIYECFETKRSAESRQSVILQEENLESKIVRVK